MPSGVILPVHFISREAPAVRPARCPPERAGTLVPLCFCEHLCLEVPSVHTPVLHINPTLFPGQIEIAVLQEASLFPPSVSRTYRQCSLATLL